MVRPKDSVGGAALVAVAAPNERKAKGVVVAAHNEGVVPLCCPSFGKAKEVPVNPNEDPPVAGAAAETVDCPKLSPPVDAGVVKLYAGGAAVVAAVVVAG